MPAQLRALSLLFVLGVGIGLAGRLESADPGDKPSRPDKTEQQKPDRTKPDATKPDGTKDDGTKPDQTKPDGTKPDSTKPAGVKPDGTKPEQTKPDGTKPDGTKPEQTKPDGTKPDSNKPDGTKPDQTKPDGTKPDATKPDGTKPRNKDEQSKPDKSDDAAAREAHALEFAKANHPELAGLLEQLRSSNPKAFANAVAELIKAQERLARVQERTPDRYESELALWKLDSRIRLMAAQSVMKDTDEVKAELRDLLAERRALKLSRLKEDRERQQARLQKLDDSIAEMQAAGDQAVDKELEQLLGQARKRVREVKPDRTAPTSVQDRKTDRTEQKSGQEKGTEENKDSKEKK